MQAGEDHNWQLIQAGDKKAYEQVFRNFYQPLCNYSCSVLKDMDEAEEVVQTVFYNLWNKRENLQVGGSIKPYLYRAVHNDSLNRIKHKKVRHAYAADYKASAGHPSQGGAEPIVAKELKKEIDNALASLPEQCGIVFRMSRFEHLKYQEIADQLNISVKTVENHMGKALKLMRERLKDYLQLILMYLFLF